MHCQDDASKGPGEMGETWFREIDTAEEAGEVRREISMRGASDIDSSKKENKELGRAEKGSLQCHTRRGALRKLRCRTGAKCLAEGDGQERPSKDDR